MKNFTFLNKVIEYNATQSNQLFKHACRSLTGYEK